MLPEHGVDDTPLPLQIPGLPQAATPREVSIWSMPQSLRQGGQATGTN